MNETKRMMMEAVERDPWAEFTFWQRLRFCWALYLFDRLVTRLIERAYVRGVINSRQMHELEHIWIDACGLPEKQSFSTELLPADLTWYRRGERDPIEPCVFANFVNNPNEYFTAVYAGRDEDKKTRGWFCASGPWTHWHPLEKTPDVGAEALSDAAEQMALVSHAQEAIDKELRFGGKLR